MTPKEHKQMMKYLTRPKQTIRLPVTKYDTKILDPIKTPPTFTDLVIFRVIQLLIFKFNLTYS